MIEPAIDWATSPGPPNYVFVIALLTTPALWSRYVKNFAKRLYESRFGE